MQPLIMPGRRVATRLVPGGVAIATGRSPANMLLTVGAGGAFYGYQLSTFGSLLPDHVRGHRVSNFLIHNTNDLVLLQLEGDAQVPGVNQVGGRVPEAQLAFTLTWDGVNNWYGATVAGAGTFFGARVGETTKLMWEGLSQ